jgi:hypothetical protein
LHTTAVSTTRARNRVVKAAHAAVRNRNGRLPAAKYDGGRVPARTWPSRGADVAESRHKCGRVAARMWPSRGADVGRVAAQTWADALLQPFVREVDAQLLERVLRKRLEAEDVQHADEREGALRQRQPAHHRHRRHAAEDVRLRRGRPHGRLRRLPCSGRGKAGRSAAAPQAAAARDSEADRRTGKASAKGKQPPAGQ